MRSGFPCSHLYSPIARDHGFQLKIRLYQVCLVAFADCQGSTLAGFLYWPTITSSPLALLRPFLLSKAEFKPSVQALGREKENVIPILPAKFDTHSSLVDCILTAGLMR